MMKDMQTISTHTSRYVWQYAITPFSHPHRFIHFDRLEKNIETLIQRKCLHSSCFPSRVLIRAIIIRAPVYII